MKFLIIASLVLSSLSSFACSCIPAKFSKEDAVDAVLRFAEQKLGISKKDVIELNLISSEGFLTTAGSTAMTIFTARMSENQKACEISCAKVQNIKSTFYLKYQSHDKTCTQEVDVKMKSAIFNEGYSSTVITKLEPHCI